MKMIEKSNDGPVDILLTYPSDGLRIFQSMIPIGLLSIGTVLRNAGFRVTIIDFNHYSNDFKRQLRFLSPKIIGIGGTTPSRSGSFLTARIAKNILPDVPIVYGGVNATFTAREVLEEVHEIDYVVRGEGELAFLRLCNVLTGRSSECRSTIPGVCSRTPEGIVVNKPERINDLSQLPIPDRSLLRDTYQLRMEFIGGPGDFLITSRGCPAACNFCSASRMFSGGVRLRPMDSVMGEVEYLVTRKNLSGLKLFDSTFTADRPHVEAFCKEIARFKLPWECEIRADTVDASLLKLMRESGCYYINIGMETSNERHLKTIAKNITPKQVLDVLATCRHEGIRSKVFFTFGHLQQTFGECLEDIRFIEKNRKQIDFFGVTVGMRIYPGTRLEEVWRQKKIMKPRFSWTRKAAPLRNLLLLEPGDVPILYQKQLGAARLMVVLYLLFFKRLICTESFLVRMVAENCKGIAAYCRKNLTYTRHRIERCIGADLGKRCWKDIVISADEH